MSPLPARRPTAVASEHQQAVSLATFSEARSALDGLTAIVGHWVLADGRGNIGYASPVNLPLRKSFLGTVPVPGWNGKYEWDGFVPAEELPWIENPPKGFIATANNQVVQPESTGYPINFEGDVPFRVQRINQRLALGRSGNISGPDEPAPGRRAGTTASRAFGASSRGASPPSPMLPALSWPPRRGLCCRGTARQTPTPRRRRCTSPCSRR